MKESLSFSMAAIAEVTGVKSTIYAISAKLAYEGKQEGNIEGINQSVITLFEDALDKFLQNDKGKFLIKSYRTKLISIADDLSQYIDFMQSILNGSIEALKVKINTFKYRVEVAGSMKREAIAIVEAELDNTTKVFEEELRGFRQEQMIDKINFSFRVFGNFLDI